MKKKILIVFGTRPEAIKMAPVILEFRKYPEKFNTVICVTGQHREMLDQVLALFNIVPDYDLDIMKPDQDLFDITSQVLMGMRSILKEVTPDLVFVHGDTTTSTATSLAAFYNQIPVAHVEAGLRTGNIYSPFPEEMNRSITGRIATWHFAPTIWAKENLMAENICESQIIVTGNTVIDALQWVVNKISNESGLVAELISLIREKGYDVLRLKEGRKLVLITGHRRENFGDGFQNICQAIRNLSADYPEIDFVYPVHLNPNVRKPVQEILGHNHENKNVYLIDPLDYLPFTYLMSVSYIILTDSGGIQEEAPSLGKPVLVMRNTTERPEALESGVLKLVGTNRLVIEKAMISLLDDYTIYQSMSRAINPYGDGKASERIVAFISTLK